MSFFSDESKVKQVVFWLGLTLSRLILKALAVLAQKTKTTADDEAVARLQETLDNLKNG